MMIDSTTNLTHLKPLSPAHQPFYLVRSTLIGDDPRAIGSVLQEHLDFLKPPIATDNRGISKQLLSTACIFKQLDIN